jgi:hypothetical protein
MPEPELENELSSRIQLEYVKSNLFRVIHTDGAIADENPNGHITVTLFSQRFSVPEKVLLDFNQEGEIIKESFVTDEDEEKVDRKIIREVDVISIMSISVARQLAFQILEETGGFEGDELDDEQEDKEQEDKEYKNE